MGSLHIGLIDYEIDVLSTGPFAPPFNFCLPSAVTFKAEFSNKEITKANLIQKITNALN